MNFELSPKHISQYDPEEYREYVRGLWKAKEVKAKKPTEMFTYSISKKEVLSVRCKRNPKIVLLDELEAMRIELKWTLQEAWAQMKKRKIKIGKEEKKAPTKSS